MTAGLQPPTPAAPPAPEGPGEGRAHERGSVTLWVLYWALSVLFISGFSIDLWRGVSVRRGLQEQAEAAAAAGANAVDANVFRVTGRVVIDPARADALARANLAAQSDAALIDNATVTVNPATQEVTVELRARVPFTLVKVFLAGEEPVQVGARARAAPRIGGP